MDPSTDEILQILQLIRTGGYVGYSVMCLVLYELVITINQEIEVVWKRKFTITSLLLLSTRWLMIVNPIVGNFSGETICRPLYTLTIIIYAVITFMVSLFPALRIYAIWKETKIGLVFPPIIFLLGAVAIGTNIFDLTRSTVMYDPVLDTCVQASRYSLHVSTILLYLTRPTAIAANVLALVLTWMRSFRHLRQVHQLQDDGTSLTVVLLRDGTTYFGALLVIDILQLVTFTAATSISMPTYVAPFLDTLPALLTQRFMLNLRQLHGTRDTADTAPVSRLTLSFRAPTDLLGNAGEDLDYGSYDERGSDGTLERGGYQGSGERPLSTLGEEPKSASADGLEGGCSNGDGVPGSGAVLAI